MEIHTSPALLIYRNVLCMSQCDLMFLSAILAKLNSLKLKKHSRTPLVKISRDLKLVGKKWQRFIISRRQPFLTTVFLTKTKPGSTYLSKGSQSLKVLEIILFNTDTYHSAKCENPWLAKQAASLGQEKRGNANAFICHFRLGFVLQQSSGKQMIFNQVFSLSDS